MSAQQRRVDDDHVAAADQQEIRTLFKAHLSPAFTQLIYQRTDIDRPEPGVSLATCEKVPTSETADPSTSGDSGQIPPETVYKDPPSEGGEPGPISDATSAIRAALSRDRERQRKVLALIGEGEIAHAKRLANCRQKSVQLECPEMAGGCGSENNFVPVSCGSRLCPDCMRRRQGELAKQYGTVVAGWDHPTMFRLGSPKRVKPERLESAVDALRGAFGRLRRRVIPPNGEGYSWEDWKSSLIAIGRTDLARRWQKRYVDQGKGIPFDEVVSSGFYGIDVKQKDDGLLNVHAHVLADVPWLPQEALSELWGEIHAAPVVDIRRVDGRNSEDMEKAAMEVVGYAAKAPEFLKPEEEAAYLTALKGSKLAQPFGNLHGNTPQLIGNLRCCDCEVAPSYWNYLDVVDGMYETALVGSTADGDRPPPERN